MVKKQKQELLQVETEAEPQFPVVEHFSEGKPQMQVGLKDHGAMTVEERLNLAAEIPLLLEDLGLLALVERTAVVEVLASFVSQLSISLVFLFLPAPSFLSLQPSPSALGGHAAVQPVMLH